MDWNTEKSYVVCISNAASVYLFLFSWYYLFLIFFLVKQMENIVRDYVVENYKDINEEEIKEMTEFIMIMLKLSPDVFLKSSGDDDDDNENENE